MPPHQTFQSGTQVPWSGTYALIRSSGHPTGVSMWREAGERLPLAVAEDGPPLSYQLVGEPPAVAVAA